MDAYATDCELAGNHRQAATPTASAAQGRIFQDLLQGLRISQGTQQPFIVPSSSIQLSPLLGRQRVGGKGVQQMIQLVPTSSRWVSVFSCSAPLYQVRRFLTAVVTDIEMPTVDGIAATLRAYFRDKSG